MKPRPHHETIILPEADPSWRDHANCKGVPQRVFFEERGTNGYFEARELCAACTVSAECLAYALARPELVGFWAGTTERERGHIRATTQVAAPCVQCGVVFKRDKRWRRYCETCRVGRGRKAS